MQNPKQFHIVDGRAARHRILREEADHVVTRPNLLCLDLGAAQTGHSATGILHRQRSKRLARELILAFALGGLAGTSRATAPITPRPSAILQLSAQGLSGGGAIAAITIADRLRLSLAAVVKRAR
jgi:hypothetical protein